MKQSLSPRPRRGEAPGDLPAGVARTVHTIVGSRQNVVPISLISKQIFEARRGQLGIAHRMLDRFVSQIALDRAGINAIVCQLVPAGVAQHVWVYLNLERRCAGHAFDHCLKAQRRKRSRTLADKNKR